MPAAPLDLDALALRISGSLLRLRASSPFFGALSLFARFLPTSEVPTACTDGRDVFYNPSFVADLVKEELDGLLLHEVLHAALLHGARRGKRDRTRWGIAADIVVNGIVAAQPGMKLPATPVRAPAIEQLSVEEIYALLEPEPDAACPSCLRAGLEPSPEAAAQLETYWHVALRQAEAVARSSGRGDLPAGMERLLHQLAPRLDWRSRLWRFLARTPTDFGDFDRRFVHLGLYLESLAAESLHAFIAIDTSGSISGPLLDLFLGELRGILGAYPHIHAELYYADHDLYGPFELSPGHPVPAPLCGGGTRFEPFFERVESASATGVESVLVYMSDGFGTFPEQAPAAPVLWVVPPGGAPDEAFPFGEVVRLLDEGGRAGV